MRRVFITLLIFSFVASSGWADSIATAAVDTSLYEVVDTVPIEDLQADTADFVDIGAEMTSDGDLAGTFSFHSQLKQKFVEGSPMFMSVIALCLIVGLVLSIERIIYLVQCRVDRHKLLADIEKCIESDDVEGAKSLCRNTRGPVASICYQGLLHADDSLEDIQRQIVNYGSVITAQLERGTTWIKFFISVAPSLGFLGTVIGMVMAFDQMQEAGDIGPTIVASGMKVALITTIFGIVVALILQLFYSYINTRIDSLTTQMEDSAICLMDILSKRQKRERVTADE